MIKVSFREPDSAPWYERWKPRARGEKARALLAWRRKQGAGYVPRRGLWEVKAIKKHLTELFRGKCAYCEARLTHVSWGDVEHYRPKKKVREEPQHGGYYWLAYELRNLLLSCDECNREGGKLDQFPVDGQHARHPRHVEQERPLLLNPYQEDDPQSHLRFFTRLDGELWGNVVGTTERGKKTVEVCKLYREELVEARRRAQERVILRLLFLVASWQQKVAGIMTGLTEPGDDVSALREIGAELARLQAGEEEFSASVLAAANVYLERVGLLPALTPPSPAAAR